MSEPIKFIGGPMHGKSLMINDAARYVHVPVYGTKGLPRQADRRLWHECIYERIKFSSGKQYFRLKSGYFMPKKVED